MKNLIISVICLLVLTIPWLTYDNYAVKMSDTCRSTITEEIIPSIQSKDWVSAENSYRDIERDWASFKIISVYFTDTQIINELDGQIIITGSYIRSREEASALAEAEYLMERFSLIHQDEALSMGNVF